MYMQIFDSLFLPFLFTGFVRRVRHPILLSHPRHRLRRNPCRQHALRWVRIVIRTHQRLAAAVAAIQTDAGQTLASSGFFGVFHLGDLLLDEGLFAL